MKPVDKAPGGSGGWPRKDHGGGASKCVLCGKPVLQDYRPFCSKRCADVDLGRWLREGYAVPGTPGDAGDLSETED